MSSHHLVFCVVESVPREDCGFESRRPSELRPRTTNYSIYRSSSNLGIYIYAMLYLSTNIHPTNSHGGFVTLKTYHRPRPKDAGRTVTFGAHL